MKLLGAILASLFLFVTPALAANPETVKLCIPTTGTNCVAVTAANPLPISGSFSATLSPFTPAASGARGTPLSVTTADSSGALPTNTGSVVVSNVGTNPMYCNVNGNAATVADQLITASGGWFDFGIPSGVTTLHCIATGGSTTANAVGGTGLATGTGGGSGGGGGGGGAVFGPTAVGSAAANPPVLIGGTANGTGTGNVSVWEVISGIGQVAAAQSGTWNITNISGTISLPTGATTSANQTSQITQETATASALGTTADAPCTLPATSTACTDTAVQKAIANAVNSPIPAGSAIIGKVGIDQTTPGTTNGVQVNAALPAGANLIGKTGIDQTTDGTTNGVRQTSQYPSGAVPVTCSNTGTTAATACTLAGTTGKTTYLCSWSIRANATAATNGSNTYAGISGGTITHEMWVAPLASGMGIDEGSVFPCTPASATNTGIVATSVAPGSGGTVSVEMRGFQQ